MISNIAKESINELEELGLHPTFEDMIRLNALGLLLESANKKNPVFSTDYIQRVAAISKDISFRQPTIGHEIWLSKVERFTNNDFDTLVAIRAYALSRSCIDLPDGDDIKSVKNAIDEFCEMCKDYTTSQIWAALDYVIYGSSQTECETPLYKTEKIKDDEVEAEDWKSCVACGMLHEGKVCLFGCSQAELEQMTSRQLGELIRRSYLFHRLEVNSEIERRQRDYYSTFDCIKERLQKESKK